MTGAIKLKMLTPERKLKFLSEYMEVYINNYPFKPKPFQIWLESTLDKRIHAGKKKEAKVFTQICRYCHQPFESDGDLEKTKDHIIPISKGGFDKKINRVPCCYNCNQWKSDKLPEDWLKEVKRWAKRQTDNPHYTVAQIGLMVANIKAVSKFAKDNQKQISLYKF